MKFELGKCYRHSSGGEMFICGMACTTTYGTCLVAETNNSCDLKPIGMDEDAAQNWAEIPRSEWMKNFSKD